MASTNHHNKMSGENIIPIYVQPSLKTGVHYKNQLENVGGDHSKIIFPPEFTQFPSLEIVNEFILKQWICNYDYWQVDEIDQVFYDTFNHHPIWNNIELNNEMCHLFTF